MKRYFLLATALCTALTSFAEVENWEIDKQHTSVSFDIGHLGISTIRGLMNLDSGSIKADPQDMSKTELEVKIDVKTLYTGVVARDNHVKSDDFLSAEKHPFITFKSTAVREDKSKNKFYIDGDLTIKGKTKRVTLEANPLSEAVRKENSNKVVRATKATTTIDRFDFGIEFGKSSGVQGVIGKIVDGGVGREVAITIFTEVFKIVPAISTKAKR